MKGQTIELRWRHKGTMDESNMQLLNKYHVINCYFTPYSLRFTHMLGVPEAAAYRKQLFSPSCVLGCASMKNQRTRFCVVGHNLL